MALTLPTLSELYTFWGNDCPVDGVDEDEDVDARATFFLQASADLLYLSTNIDSTPSDPRLARLVNMALEDMTVYLYNQRDDVNEVYSPYTSETIGSYSYSKRLTSSALTGNTGVQFWDLLVAALQDGQFDANGLTLIASAPFAGLFESYYFPQAFVEGQDPSNPPLLF